MGGGSWVVQEGFLLCKRDDPASPRSGGTKPPNWKPTISSKTLKELYVVLTMNRKLEFFDGSDIETRSKVDSAYLQGFGGWDGDGLLKVDSYGLELKVERNAKSRMHLAAFNRVDLEKWCRGFMAVLDPQSATGEEVRRERHRVKKEEKRLQQEREEQIRKWKEKKARMIKEEQDRLLAREEQINNMTPLERIDDIGSLDDDTARMLEKRKQRLQRRHAPTMGRVNKAAYRRRLEEAAGGKTENVQPLHTKVVEQKTKVRVELPPPGQFFEVGGVVHNDAPLRLGSSGSDISDSSSMSSRLSSVSSVTGSRHDHVPPPPPPPRWSSTSRISMSSRASMGIPPPPPPPPLFDHDNFNDGKSRFSRSSSSLRSASFDSFAFDRDEDPMTARSSFSQSSRRISSADKGKQHIQDNMAAILGGGRPKSASRASRTSRRDSFGSTMSSVTTVSHAVPDRKAKKSANRSNGSSSPPAPEPSMANAFAASLAAIRRNRADTVEEMSVASSALSPVAANGKVRNRKRDSQLSAEGKEILKKAMAQDVSSKPTTKSNSSRRGLFDDSSSDEDEGSDTGLFGVGGRKSKAVNGNSRASASMRSSDLSVNARPTPMKKKVPAPSVSSEEVSSDSDSDNDTSFFAQPRKMVSTSPKNVHTNNIGAGGAGPSVVVLFTSSALRTEGRKSVGVFTFTLQFGNLEHTFSFTYAEFEEIHTRLMSAFPGITLPKFPSKHRLRSNTKPENMEKRGQEFRLYLQQLVALPGVLSSERFQFEYHIDGAFARALANGEKPNESASNGAQSNGRPPRSPVAPQPRKEETVSSASSRSDSSPPRAAKVKASKGLFGLDSDLESDSDTSVDTPKPLTRQRGESAASSTQRRKPRTSDFSSSVISSVAEDTQRGKKSRSRSRLSSRASSRASFAPPPPSAPPKPAVTGLPPGRPNPFSGGRGDLLAAIRQGTQLKKSDDFNDSAGGNSGGASTAAKPTPPPVTQPGSINEAITNAMAMRRIHVEYEETKSNADSDSDDDWD
ncbi:hypothetical protein PInf_028705 [Phytophthora infestans]|nr:hypothetical protein PInf_028705 [Phytophthora infestans]